MIEGLSHLTFVSSDLDRMTRLLVEGLGGRVVYDSGDATFSLSRERFFDLGGLWIAVMEGAPLPDRSYNHVAFKVAEADIDRLEGVIRDLGFEIRPPRARVPGEGRSVYFHDHDNHLFELHSGTLAERLARYGLGRGDAA
jgi:fosfomycin resistance protein FosX